MLQGYHGFFSLATSAAGFFLSVLTVIFHGKIERMRRIACRFLFALLCFSAACVPEAQGVPISSSTSTTSSPSAPPATPNPQPSVTPKELSTSTPEAPSPTTTSLPSPVLAHYRLDLNFDYDQHGGHVEEWVQYPNTLSQSLAELRLMAPLYQYRGALSITALAWSGGELDGQAIENASVDNIQLVVPLSQPLPPGESVGLRISYDFVLPSQSQVSGERPLPIGYTARQANLVDWYLFIPPYRDGVGWLAHPPSYYGENLVYDLASFEVNLRLAGGRNDLVVAASSTGKKDGNWLRFTRPNSRTFALSIGSEYVVETAQAGDVTVSSYYFPLNAEAGKRALQTTVEALELYSELFGPYPHDTLTVVEADFYDGMEYDGLYFLSRAFYNVYQGDPGDYLVSIAAHETAHQWWYGLVGNDQAEERALAG